MKDQMLKQQVFDSDDTRYSINMKKKVICQAMLNNMFVVLQNKILPNINMVIYVSYIFCIFADRCWAHS